MRFVLTLAFVLSACHKSSPPAAPAPGGGATAGQPAAGGACIKTGCGGTVCTEPGNEIMTTCEFRPEHACYQKATCERQSNGSCGWTEDPDLKACLANPPTE